MAYHIVLVEPEIPQNTGNIARTCVVTGSTLHLIKPLGFSLQEKYTRRSGLDYWKDLSFFVYENIEEFYEQNKQAKLWYFSSKVETNYTDVVYEDNCFLIFGNETKGLREKLPTDHSRCVTIPMAYHQRCLNLSNAAAVAVYEALRQSKYKSLQGGSLLLDS